MCARACVLVVGWTPQYLAKPMARQYCSAQPTSVELPPLPGRFVLSCALLVVFLAFASFADRGPIDFRATAILTR